MAVLSQSGLIWLGAEQGQRKVQGLREHVCCGPGSLIPKPVGALALCLCTTLRHSREGVCPPWAPGWPTSQALSRQLHGSQNLWLGPLMILLTQLQLLSPEASILHLCSGATESVLPGWEAAGAQTHQEPYTMSSSSRPPLHSPTHAHTQYCGRCCFHHFRESQAYLLFWTHSPLHVLDRGSH